MNYNYNKIKYQKAVLKTTGLFYSNLVLGLRASARPTR